MKPAVRLAVLLQRFARSALLGTTLIAVSLLAGRAGYHNFEGLPWLDAFSNAAMILLSRRREDRSQATPGQAGAEDGQGEAAVRRATGRRPSPPNPRTSNT